MMKIEAEIRFFDGNLVSKGRFVGEGGRYCLNGGNKNFDLWIPTQHLDLGPRKTTETLIELADLRTFPDAYRVLSGTQIRGP